MSASKEVEANIHLQVNIPQCGCCKKTIIKNSIKCNICHKSFHPGCGLKVKKCCDIELSNQISGDKMSGNSSPICEITPRGINMESTHHDLLLRIIYELESKNNLLMDKNSLLTYKVESLEIQIKNKQHEIDELNKKFVNIRPDKKHISGVVSKGNSGDSHSPVTSISAATDALQPHSTKEEKCVAEYSTAAPLRVKSKPLKKFTLTEVGQAIDKVQMSNNSVKEISKSALRDDQNSSSEWKVVRNKSRKPRKTLVVGTGSSDGGVEGLEKFKALHVSNLKPDTTIEELQNFLKNKFSNVKCEKLASRYPDSYSSFKVLIPSTEYDKALNGSNWPNKVTVHHFFHRRGMNRDRED